MRRGKKTAVTQHGALARQRERSQIKSAPCAICATVVSGRALHLDHCHASGMTRGYLCHKCNTGIGLFGDSSILMEKAIKYLRLHAMLRSAA